MSLAAFIPVAACAQKDETRPNIVFILADDLGYGDIGAFNDQSLVPTPNLDELASEGIMLTDVHTVSAVCTPSRYGFMTGRYAWRTRLKSGVLWPGDRSLIEEGRLTIGSMLEAQGYATGVSGKWHLGMDWVMDGDTPDYSQPVRLGPLQLGFDYHFGIEGSLDMQPYYYMENGRVTELPTSSTPGDEGLQFFRGGPMPPSYRHEEVTPLVVLKAHDYIQTHMATEPEKPFFLYMPLPSPHLPYLPIDKRIALSDSAVGRSGIGDYGDFVVMVDDAVGVIKKLIDDLGIAENTLFVFTSDNGARSADGYGGASSGHASNGILRGQKSSMYEGGHRVPFIARWPLRIEAGVRNDSLVSMADMLATFAAITEYSLPEDASEDGLNQLPVLLNQETSEPIRRGMVYHTGDGYYGMRSGEIVYSTIVGSGGYLGTTISTEPGELWDLAADISQTTNLYDSKPARVAEMAALLEGQKASSRTTEYPRADR